MPIDTPLHKACKDGNFEAVEMIVTSSDLNVRVDINAPGAAGRRPLHRAAGENHTRIILYLVNNGAEIDIVDKSNRTALHWAAVSGHSEAAKVLLESGANILVVTKQARDTPLHCACEAGRAEFVKTLLMAADHSALHDNFGALNSDDLTPYQLASKSKCKTVMQYLKESNDPGAKISSQSCAIS